MPAEQRLPPTPILGPRPQRSPCRKRMGERGFPLGPHTRGPQLRTELPSPIPGPLCFSSLPQTHPVEPCSLANPLVFPQTGFTLYTTFPAQKSSPRSRCARRSSPGGGKPSSPVTLSPEPRKKRELSLVGIVRVAWTQCPPASAGKLLNCWRSAFRDLDGQSAAPRGGECSKPRPQIGLAGFVRSSLGRPRPRPVSTGQPARQSRPVPAGSGLLPQEERPSTGGVLKRQGGRAADPRRQPGARQGFSPPRRLKPWGDPRAQGWAPVRPRALSLASRRCH